MMLKLKPTTRLVSLGDEHLGCTLNSLCLHPCILLLLLLLMLCVVCCLLLFVVVVEDEDEDEDDVVL